jgi:UDP-N-acetylmuramate dehydrogenase
MAKERRSAPKGKVKKPAEKPAAKETAKPKAAAPAKAKAPPAPRAPTSRRSGPQLPSTLAGQVKYDEPLSKHTTFRIGGPAKLHFSPANAEAAAGAIAWAKKEGLPWLVLGLGSNVLIRDAGFHGLVLKLGKGVDAITEKGSVWTVGAGLPTPLLARRTADAGLGGVQRLIGVPGTVGGGVFMNAGAHGQDFASVLVSATVLTASGDVKTLARTAVPFSYRHSGLAGQVVLAATLRFGEDEPGRLKADLAMLLKKRRDGTPFDQPCCGSVFKNPDVMTAGRLIDRCGLKGRRVGGAEISALHGNYIVNKGGATADDVIRLIDIARTAVFKEYGVELELEVKLIGDTK